MIKDQALLWLGLLFIIILPSIFPFSHHYFDCECLFQCIERIQIKDEEQ